MKVNPPNIEVSGPFNFSSDFETIDIEMWAQDEKEEWTDDGTGITPAQHKDFKAAAKGGNSSSRRKATAFAMVVAAVCRKPVKTLAKLEDWGYNDVLLEISEKLKL